jgi:hypothetical protein
MHHDSRSDKLMLVYVSICGPPRCRKFEDWVFVITGCRFREREDIVVDERYTRYDGDAVFASAGAQHVINSSEDS